MSVLDNLKLIFVVIFLLLKLGQTFFTKNAIISVFVFIAENYSISRFNLPLTEGGTKCTPKYNFFKFLWECLSFWALLSIYCSLLFWRMFLIICFYFMAANIFYYAKFWSGYKLYPYRKAYSFQWNGAWI